MLRKITLILLAITLVVGLCATAQAGPIKLKFGSYERDQGWMATQVFKPWMDKINADGKGIVQVEYYGGGTLLGGNPMQHLKLTLDGVADMTLVPYPYHPGRFPEVMVANIPFAAKTALEGTIAINKLYDMGLLSGFKGLIPCCLFVQPQFHLHTTFPTLKPSDLKGKKIRTAGKMQQVLIEAAGGTAVAMPITQVAENISRGVCDGTVCEWLGQTGFRINDVTKFHNNVSFGGNVMGVAMNKKKYDSLPDEAKAVLDKHFGMSFSKAYASTWDGAIKEWDEKVGNDPKHQIDNLDEAQLQAWKDKFQPAVKAWLAADPKNVKLLEVYNAEIAKQRK